ncbi:MAG: 3-oxoacid CoA-transferase [Oscillospiraceae bacterium]|jgi:propionate CoA-transferase|nr:3-oxoacid CoA-transferase [Oscillospiraceae bacterium]
MAKIVTLEEAVRVVKDGDYLLVGGFGSYASPEELLEGLAERYADTGSPKKIGVLCGITTGDKTESLEPLKGYTIGANRLRAEGLIDVFIAGNLTDARAIAYMVGENKIACYLPPLGVMLNLLRATAAGRPGVITRVGLNTFADPRLDGCAFNERAKELGPLVELTTLDGKEYLFYKAFKKADVAFIRATYADEDGNLTMSKEGVMGPELDMAIAAHNRGGTVIAQVEDIVARGTLHPKQVRVHSTLVDYVVKVKNPDNQRQCYATPGYRPELSGDVRIAGETVKPMKLSLRKVLARRGAMELKPGVIINLGSGMPSGIGSVAEEEGLKFSTTIEAGSMGGIVQEGLSFPGAANSEAFYYQLDTLDMYDGGFIDMAFLGFAEIDERGNTNVSQFAGRAIGAGGYINISQNAKKVFFLGNFSAGKADVALTDSGLDIKSDGETSKFVKSVQQVTFSGDYALENGQEVMYITERAVFKLTKDGLLLTEIADGVDLQKDVLDKMEFAPQVSPELKKMDARLFREAKMGL